MLRFTPMLLATLAIATTGGCQTLDRLTDIDVGKTTLRNAEGTPVGTARLIDHGETVSLAVVATGLSEGEHGLHIHTAGDCSSEGFTSAKGHLNPTGKTHGTMSANGAHLGDLPNLKVGANRSATLDFDLPGSSSQVLASIFDEDGSALVIHDGPDDYKSDPAGNSGKRVACGVIDRSR